MTRNAKIDGSIEEHLYLAVDYSRQTGTADGADLRTGSNGIISAIGGPIQMLHSQ